MTERPRILAIDYGEVRIGLAISDPLGMFASGLGSVESRNVFEELEKLFATYPVGRIIVGMPLTLRGEAGGSAEKTGAFIEALRKRTEIPVVAIDERFTSVMAANTIREMGIGKKKREREKGKLDELSAVHLLQGYLQSLPPGAI